MTRRLSTLLIVVAVSSASFEARAAECVPPSGHWKFWGQCSGDVPMSAGSAVYSMSYGQVVQVYPSCGGYAGKSVRIDYGDDRYMYAHLNTNISQGQWVWPGTYIGSVYGGPGPVYCNASLTSCGIGKSSTRQTECWTGPHLHREGNCCGASDCNSGYDTVGAIREKWLSLGGCSWAAPIMNEGAACCGGRFTHMTGGKSIYWTWWTGAHAVQGAIRNHWEWLGWEWGWLGFPVSDEYYYDGTPWGMPGWVAESEFEGGWLSYAFANGQIYEWHK